MRGVTCETHVNGEPAQIAEIPYVVPERVEGYETSRGALTHAQSAGLTRRARAAGARVAAVGQALLDEVDVDSCSVRGECLQREGGHSQRPCSPVQP